MRILLVMCIIGLAGTAFAKPPGLFREQVSRGFRNVKSVGRFKLPMNPLHVVRNQLSKSMKSASHPKKIDCDLCPPAIDINPCSCSCVCNTTKCLANINCDSTLGTVSELQRVLSLTSYPVRDYATLLVEKTFLSGAITKSLLGSTVSFKEININHNGFDYVDKNAFNNTGHTLKKLVLNNNKILEMDWTLKDMPNIQYIDMSHNWIAFIPGDAMHSRHLCFLNLSNNNLKDVGISAFNGLSKLTNLDLSNNSLTKLSSNFFAPKQHEDVHLGINLSDNLITSVEVSAISGVQKLTVDLRNNRLETLKEECFRDLIDSTDATIHIDVTGNPIACDCSLDWIVQNSTVASCFDDFTVCETTIQNVTTENLGDCNLN